MVVNKVIDNFAAYPGSLIAIAVFYCLQIYCDFSGGIDIVRGAAQMLGINLRKISGARILPPPWQIFGAAGISVLVTG